MAKLWLELKQYRRQIQLIKKEMNCVYNHSQHPEFNLRANEFKSVNEKLITGIPKCLCKPLMRLAYKLLIRDDSTFEELMPQEHELWKKIQNR